MLSSHAGLPPYYSKVDTIDPWGLNTSKYSKIPLQSKFDFIDHTPDIALTYMDYKRLSLKPVSNNKLKVGRDCNKSPISHTYGYCGYHEMNQAIFDGARELNYKFYLVPGDDFSNVKVSSHIYMINPKNQSIFTSENYFGIPAFKIKI